MAQALTVPGPQAFLCGFGMRMSRWRAQDCVAWRRLAQHQQRVLATLPGAAPATQWVLFSIRVVAPGEAGSMGRGGGGTAIQGMWKPRPRARGHEAVSSERWARGCHLQSRSECEGAQDGAGRQASVS